MPFIRVYLCSLVINSYCGMKRFSWRLLVFSVFSCSAVAADNSAALSTWLNAQTNIHSWSADFVQTRRFKTLTQPLTESGTVRFAEPNRFRWELGHPPKTIAVR